ncbi:MAG: iron-containing alcohol dehydrogenase [Termitinemataceae bacterium]
MLYRMYARLYQSVFRLVSPLLPWREPELLEGPDTVLAVPSLLVERNIHRVLLVTDQGIMQLGLPLPLLDALRTTGIETTVYDGVRPNPTISNIEEALKLYTAQGCEALIAFGGGSSMDCAKGIGARLARPTKTIPQMKGVLKIRKKIPLLIAIPTTAGTGSEATLAAVISNPETHEKYPINDHVLIPHVAVLDPKLTIALPPHITSTTGMDALTHAIEAFIGKSNTRFTERAALEAGRLIFHYLPRVYTDGADLDGRGQLLRAAYLAGAAFTRAYVGYVHAMAHQLGGFYNTPHGLANAVILPYVLDYFGPAVWPRLGRFARETGIAPASSTDEQAARICIEQIKTMNHAMNIPDTIDTITETDIPTLVRRALKEANPLYPVPRILGPRDLTELFYRVGGYKK